MKNINVNYNRTFNILSQTYKKYKLLKSKMANLLSLLLTNFKTNNYIYGSSFLVYLKKQQLNLLYSRLGHWNTSKLFLQGLASSEHNIFVWGF